MENSYYKSNTRLYKMWNHMKFTCYNPKSYYYNIRGALGIKVCDEWKDTKTFCDWALANGYADTKTLNRIDETRDFSPENCIWTEIYVIKNKRLNNIWKHMKNKCNNPNLDQYRHTGGLGIKVCDEWNTYNSFYDWALANGYQDNLTLERIDKTKNFGPDNCRWSTKKEQNNNHMCNRLLTYKGKTQTITQWARELGHSSSGVIARRIDSKLPKHLVFFPGRLIREVSGKSKIEKLKQIWTDIKQKCFNPRDSRHKNYGARGISVCDSWLDYCNFKLWAEDSGFKENLALVRKDFNKDYCPENCVWADGKLGSKNNIRSTFYTHNGETLNVADWARKLNISPTTFAKRMNSPNMPEDKKFRVGNMIHDPKERVAEGKYSRLLRK